MTLEHVAKLLLRFRATKHYDVRSLFMQLRTLPDYEYAPNGKRTITPFRKEALFG